MSKKDEWSLEAEDLSLDFGEINLNMSQKDPRIKYLEHAVRLRNQRIARLERALKLIASGMLGDRVLSELELSGIASAALEKVP